MAPEFRGAPFCNLAAALACALTIIFGAASLHVGAVAAELQRRTGDSPPTFSLPDTSGADVALESARGHIVLVHFFTTWCEPCVTELPALNGFAARAKGHVKVLAISVAEVDLRVRRFLETTPVAFPVLLDRERATAKAWNVSTLPTTIVLDADLRARLVVESDFAWDSIGPSRLTDLLAVGAGSARTENAARPPNGGG